MLEPKIKIYDKSNIADLPWPETEWSRNVRKIIKPFVEQSPNHFIDNVHTSMKVLLIDDLPLPITICEPSVNNSYVCSPYCHYVTYGREEINGLENNTLKVFLGGLINLLGKFLKICDVDKNIYVNNWLLPTNLYPKISKEQIKAIIKELTSLYPDHTVAFRSINPFKPEGLLEQLKTLGFSFVLGRSIFYTDTQSDLPFKSRMFKSDQKLISHSAYQMTQDKEKLKDFIPRLKNLYTALNIEKYSKCNPQFNDHFVRLALETEWMTFKAFEKSGSIDAVCGYFTNERMMTSPFFGYDLSIPTESGLYRHISTYLLLDAKEKQMLLHQSSGAGHYKKLRRAKENLEYTAVYNKHLGFKRRLCWKVLEQIMSTFGKKFMENYE